MEAMIASTLSLFLLASLAYIFWARQVHSERIDARVELNEVALTTLGHLKREIAESNFHLVDVSDSDAVIFLSPRTTAGEFGNVTGGLLFHTVVCYRLDTSGPEPVLLRQQEPLTIPTANPSDPSAMVPARNKAYFETSGLPPRVIARGIASFEATRLSLDPTDSRAGRTHLSLGLEREVRGRRFGVELTTSVLPKN